MADSVPFVSVLLPCRNEAEHIEDCLRSILSQKVPEGGMEIIVADGRSNDGTRELLQGLESATNRSWSKAESAVPRSPVTLRIIDNPGLIVSTGLNAAIRVARGEIILRMDAHTKYAADYVCQCVAALVASGADNVGGPARTLAGTLWERAVAAAYHSPFSVGGARFHDVHFAGYVDTVPYGCWRRDTFERFGYFDEELVRNQDDEHNLRIIRGGGKVYQTPCITSWYRPRGTLASLFNQYAQYGYWKVRVIQKHHLPASWRHLIPGAFVSTLAGLLLLCGFSILLAAAWTILFGPSTGVEYLIGRNPGFAIAHLSAIVFCCEAICYLLALFTASIITSMRSGWRLLPLLPAVFAAYHIGYGYGFLRGVWDLRFSSKQPGARFLSLTR